MNAKDCLANVNAYIEIGEAMRTRYGRLCKWKISHVCEDLSIFDWYNETLSLSQLKDMRKFLNAAIKYGYTGYVCFKVGTKYCSHGMWAYKSENNDGACLFHSFRRGDNYWDACDDNENWVHPEEDITKIRDIVEKVNMI